MSSTQGEEEERRGCRGVWEGKLWGEGGGLEEEEEEERERVPKGGREINDGLGEEGKGRERERETWIGEVTNQYSGIL